MSKNVKRSDSKVEGEPGMKKFKTSLLSEHVESAEFQELFTKHWHSSEPVETDRIEIITAPYRICKVSNFLKDDAFIDRLKDELKDVECSRQDIDLYQFQQTEDLVNVKSENIAKFYEVFKSDVTNWMKEATGINLSGKLSMSSATYSDTDYLLCHDDNLGDRRIAFILYLSKNWMPEDGGSFDIFDTDENGQPNNIVRSLVPEYNSLVFFEVVDNSYHQVAEITSTHKLRLSINGWFHGPRRESNKKRRLERICKYYEPEHIEVDLGSHLSEVYLFETIVENIQQTIEKDSFIYLPDFLLPEKYEELSDDVKSPDIKWEKIGPADLQNYEVADANTLPHKLKEFYNIFKSILIFHLLKQYTELDLVPEIAGLNPKMTIELQRWSRGCYMLINDKGTTEAMEDTEDSEEDNEYSDALNLYSKAETNPKSSKVSVNTCDRSETGKSDHGSAKIVTTQATGSDRTIATEPKHEPVPEKNVQKQSKTGVEEVSVKGKRKASISETASSSRKNLSEKTTTVDATDENDSSDIEDYLSNPDSSSGCEMSDYDDEENYDKPGTLDVLIQFHTNNVPEDATIDYINPSQEDGGLIHVPPQDNHLCLVYRTAGTCRCNKYVNHYCEDYFYTLVCSYYE